MSLYITDPREKCIIPESGITLEEDNRFETMYHWGAKVLDLCEMEIEEYMKPMTVIIDGYDGVRRKSVVLTIEVISPSGDVISSDGNVIGETDGNGEWRVLWMWDTSFVGEIKTSITVTDENGIEHEITTIISDNQDKSESINFTDINGSIISIDSYGIAEKDSESEEITGKTITIFDEESNMRYDIDAVIPIETIYILYGYGRKSEELQYDDLSQFNIEEAEDQDGFSFNMVIPISTEYQQKVRKLDEEEMGQDEFNQWADDYESQNRYTLRFYVPQDKESGYTYSLFNDNPGQMCDAELVKTDNVVEYNGKQYAEYVNANDTYLYDDRINTFGFNIKIAKK